MELAEVFAEEVADEIGDRREVSLPERRCSSPRGELGEPGAEERTSARGSPKAGGQREVRHQVAGEARKSLAQERRRELVAELVGELAEGLVERPVRCCGRAR